MLFLFRSPFKKLNSSLIFHRMLPQNDSNENLFILLWKNLRICNCLKAKFWENRYSKLLVFIRDVFFLFRWPFKKLNNSLIFHQISPQNDSNENLFILLWENLRIWNCLKAKFWENRYSKLLIFIQDFFWFPTRSMCSRGWWPR